MFNPWQISEWHRRVPNEPSLRREFEGFHLESVEVFPMEIPVAPAQVSIGLFYPPDRILGEPFDPVFTHPITVAAPQNAARPRVETYKKARAVGFSAILTAEGRVIEPHTGSILSKHAAAHASSYIHQGFVLEQTDDRCYTRFAAPPERRSSAETALFFPDLEPGNFGSFLVRQLPHLLQLISVGADADCYIAAERTPWLLSALQLLGFPPRPVYGVREVSGQEFSSVTACMIEEKEGFIHPETRDEIYRRILSAVVSRSLNSPGRKIYIARDLSTVFRPDYRPMVNETQIIETVSSSGFEVIRPETLPFAEQIRTFASASHLIGPSGSGMLNAMFAPRRARVVELESSSYGTRQHARAYSSSGLDYSFVFGSMLPGDERPAHLRRWFVPEELFKAALEWSLS